MAKTERKFTGNYTARAYKAHPGRNPNHIPGGKNRQEYVTRKKENGETYRVVTFVDRSRWSAH